jgi:hypothetical protein|nr:MAG TPA: TRASH domain protein [Caudoviricetes sp.]
MIKGSKCEWCDEVINCEALVLEFEGQRFYFHDRECMMQWLLDKVKPFLYFDDTIEEY